MSLLNNLPIFPLYYSGKTKFMPIHCSELTNIIYHLISQNIDSNVIECVGPETLSFKEILEKLLKLIKKKKNINSFPFIFGKIICLYFRKITQPLLTPDQLRLLSMTIFLQVSIRLILILVYQAHFYLRKK